MDTVESAVTYLRHQNTPYWWAFSGNAKVGESLGTDNIEDSISRFRETMAILPAGSYKLECSDKPQNRSGSFKMSFTKGQVTAAAQTMQPIINSNNVYGISDAVYQKIQDEARQKILVEQMSEDFKEFMKEWPTYKKMIDKHEAHLKDEDGDGTPDFMETARKASETVKNIGEVKKVFTGGSLFG